MSRMYLADVADAIIYSEKRIREEEFAKAQKIVCDAEYECMLNPHDEEKRLEFVRLTDWIGAMMIRFQMELNQICNSASVEIDKG